MNKAYTPSEWEQKLYKFWEEKGLFSASADSEKEPFSIILPPPNANANLHVGHAMYVYEDIMIRYNKLLGKETLWLPGADHAGFETQYVFEKYLAKKDQSRFDFDRETLFKMIWDFVMENRGTMENQLRRLGFALDWEKMKFTMDEDIVKIVHHTFKRMFDDGLVYRDYRLVNYCVKDGTSFSDLEVEYKDAVSPLYYLKYGPFELATVRPETKFGDTAVAVHPDDERYQKWIDKEIEVEGLNGPFKIKVVADEMVDPKFGTGAVKITPAHDFNDYEVAKRHNLPFKQVIGFDGRLNELTGPYKGLKIKAAREKVVEDLKAKGLLVRVDENYQNRIATCYKCGTVLEPLPKEQWFIKVRPLADKAIEAVEKGEIKIYPTRFKKIMIDWLNKFHDWNISRQIVWGIRIPAYQCKSKSRSVDKSEWFVSETKPEKCQICGECEFEQDTDTFDTWFSSSQWPFVTLMTQKNGEDMYKKFYPTSVMETGYDILPAWVVRMAMVGIYATGKVPFKSIFLHGMVRDRKGQKMSKSKGNVVNPMDMVDKYGADALRATLIFQSKEGGDVAFTEDKIIGMRNFANKLWNVGRFLELLKSEQTADGNKKTPKLLKELEEEFATAQKTYHKNMKGSKFSQAFNDLYEFLWHRLADFYIEELKEEVRSGNIEVFQTVQRVYKGILLMLHPYMPFVTEAIWSSFQDEDGDGKTTSILEERFS